MLGSFWMPGGVWVDIFFCLNYETNAYKEAVCSDS